MTDALEKARDALGLALIHFHFGLQKAAPLIDALERFLDAREEKAEPDPRDARIAELERENAWLIECNGRSAVRAETADDRADEFERKYDALLTTWNESRERHLKAEATLAELRVQVEKAISILVPFNDTREIEAALALLSPEGEAKGEDQPENQKGGDPDNRGEPTPQNRGNIAQPARDADPVPAPLVTLDECPPGLFEFNGRLGFKSEYRTVTPWTGAAGMPDAYVVESGEYFWGGTTHSQKRATLRVRPIAARSAGITQGGGYHG